MQGDGENLLNRLWEIQDERKWSNSALAREIGVAQSTISRLRRRQPEGGRGTRLTLSFTQKVLRRFPELSIFLVL